MYSKNVVKSLAVYKEISDRDSWRCIGKIRKKNLAVYRKKSVKSLSAYRCIKRDPLRCIEKSERPLAVYRINKRDPGGV